MSTEQEIWQAIVRANEAWRSGNPAGVGELFHEDVVLAVPGSAERRHGRAAMVRTFDDYVRQVDTLAFEVLDHQVDVMGDAAVATYRFAVRYELNGQVHEEVGRETLTFVRRDGKWGAIWRMQTPVSDREQRPSGSDGER
jgi:uncharacterized protein (TIGR02246 family)